MGRVRTAHCHSGVVGEFQHADAGQLDVVALLVIMLQVISMYMVAALVLPNVNGDAIVDLRDHYFAHRTWFFGAVFGSVFFSLAKDLALYGHLPGQIDSMFKSLRTIPAF